MSWIYLYFFSISDLRHDPVAVEQQVGEGASAGGRPHLQDRRGDEDLPGGEADGSPGGKFILFPSFDQSYS
jgi:hypothetical protein